MENAWDINLNVTETRRKRNSSDLPLAEFQPLWQAEAKGSPSRGEKKNQWIERAMTKKNQYHLSPENSGQTN